VRAATSSNYRAATNASDELASSKLLRAARSARTAAATSTSLQLFMLLPLLRLVESELVADLTPIDASMNDNSADVEDFASE
jgi:hypothetical protein